MCGILIVGINGNLGNFMGWSFGWSDGYFSGWGGDSNISESGSEYVDSAGISKIDVEWTSGSVDVKTHSDSRIYFVQKYTGQLDESSKMAFQISGGTLKIKDSNGTVRSWSVFNQSTSLELYIPEDMSLGGLDIETASASQRIDSVSANKIDVESVSGKVDLYSCSANELLAESVSGSISSENTSADHLDTSNVSGKTNMSGSFVNVDCETVSGSINISSQVCPDVFDAETISGSITLTIPDNDGFSLKYDRVSGSVSCDFPTSENHNVKIYGNGSARFDISTVSGGVSIRKAG